jgi:hypothetical protein
MTQICLLIALGTSVLLGQMFGFQAVLQTFDKFAQNDKIPIKFVSV